MQNSFPSRSMLPCALLTLATLCTVAGPPSAVPTSPEGLARQILDTTGPGGGLLVHVGCGNGRLTAALKTGDSVVIHGLDTDSQHVAAARRYLDAAGLYGPVTVEQWFPPALPYADNLVAVLVVSAGADLPRQEILRVLRPGGQAVFLPKNSRQPGSPVAAPALRRIVKPWPEELDQWTHFLHDATNNAVARDRVVGPPGRLQWAAGPRWSKEHDVTPCVFAPVSSKGRLFYILNESPVCTIDEELPDHYSVVARDAFSGVLLWTRRMQDWYSSRVIWGHIPVHAERRLVADDNRVYVTLGLQARITALDATTGESVRDYPDTEHTSEIICRDGCLIAVKRRTHPLDGLLAGRDGSRFRRGFAGPVGGGEGVIAVRADSGERLWESPRQCLPLTLAAAADRVLLAETEDVVCLDLKSGEELWTASCTGTRTLVIDGDTVLAATADPKTTTLTAFDLKTGRRLWSNRAGNLPNFLFFFAPLDIFVIDDVVWGQAEGLDWNRKPGSGQLLGLALRSGEVCRKIPLAGSFTTGHHVRCYKGKASSNFLLFNKRGIEFVDLTPGAAPVPNSYQWVRGTCRYGILPCNGLIYAPPHACACYPGAKVGGFLALAPHAPVCVPSRETPAGPRLIKGPAYGQHPALPAASPPTADWPTYRSDARRSAHAPMAVAAELAVAWRADTGVPLTSPVAAEGVVLAAATDACTVYAWEADDGRVRWRYAAGARIDSPPTIHRGTAVFGCRDGWVYCLRLADGEVVWRFRAAPQPRHVGAGGRLESAWPVHGSVLVHDGTVYTVAGRSSFLDGGIYVYGLDAATGAVRCQTRLSGPDPQAPGSTVTSGRMPGAVPDIMVSDGSSLYLRHVQLNWQLTATPPAQFDWGVKTDTHLLAGSGFLDDTLFNRTIWQYGRRIDRSQLLAIDGTDVFGVRVYEGISWNCPVHHVGDGHLIFRQDVSKPVPQPPPAKKRRLFRIPAERYAWQTRVPLRVRAMLAAGSPSERLFVAGVPDAVAPDDPAAFIEGRRGATLLVLDAHTGKQVNTLQLDAPPVWDGMAAANGRLYLTTATGTVLCLAGQ